MKNNGRNILIYLTLLIVGLYFLISGLIEAQAFLAPLSIATLLSMVMLPVCQWLEKKGFNRGLASFSSVLAVMLFFVMIAGVIATQVKSFSDSWPEVKEQMMPRIEQLQEFVADKTGISVEEQQQKLNEQMPEEGSRSKEEEEAQEQQQDGNAEQEEDSSQKEAEESSQQEDEDASGSSLGGSSGMIGSIASTVGTAVGRVFGVLGDFLLMLIYIFFFLLYRRKFKNFVLKATSDDKRDLARELLEKSTKVAQNYLSGRLLLIIILAILYSIGLLISGVQNAVLISILAAVLSLLPFVGNAIGYALAVGMAAFSAGGAEGIIGVSITFAVAQFVETYILEPYVVGDKVQLNPVLTILVVVLGGAVWGIVGMIIAIPVFGILKIIFDHIPPLSPLGYLFGEKEDDEEDDDQQEKEPGMFDKVKAWAAGLMPSKSNKN